MKEREELYDKVPLPGDSIPINVELFDLSNDIPEDREIPEHMWELSNGPVSGTSFICVDDFKELLQGMEEKRTLSMVGDKSEMNINDICLSTSYKRCGKPATSGFNSSGS